jgi:hypothetical protein
MPKSMRKNENMGESIENTIENALGWTADFKRFKDKIESSFGSITELAKEDPGTYAHLVLSHGFMEYASCAGVYHQIRERVIGERAKSGDPKYCSLNERMHIIGLPGEAYSMVVSENKERFDQLLEKEYYKWAIRNNLEKSLLERGWIEYMDD